MDQKFAEFSNPSIESWNQMESILFAEHHWVYEHIRWS